MPKSNVCLCFLLAALLHQAAFGQNRNLTGKVTDSSGNALSGVSITLKDSKSGTVTDENGLFRLPVQDKTNTVFFSLLGYQSEYRVAEAGKFLDLVLNQVNTSLGEVVVVGYG